MESEKPAWRSAQRGWVLYDDSCGFCRRRVSRWKRALDKRGWAVAPLQAPWVAEALDVPASQLLDDFRLLLADGRVISGAQAYRHLMRNLRCAYPLYLLSAVPVLRQAFDRGYRQFATHRHRFSRACGMLGADEDEADTRAPDQRGM